jgi:hypothetical protein
VVLIKIYADTSIVVGIALACHAAVKSKEGLYTVRFLLGLVGLHSVQYLQASLHLSDNFWDSLKRVCSLASFSR